MYACAGPSGPPVDDAPSFEPTVQGLLFEGAGATLRLLPRVRIGGAWFGAGAQGACEVVGDAVQCPAGAAGRVIARQSTQGSGHAEAAVELASAATVDALELAGPLHLPGANAWISNGFQSWSQSGAIAIGPAPTDKALAAALAVRGDGEVIRTGRELSWQWTMAGGGGSVVVAGVTDTTRWKCWAQVTRPDVAAPDELWLRLVCGGAGEAVAAQAAATLTSEPWSVQLVEAASAGSAQDNYGFVIKSRRWPTPPEFGWNSWYELWDGVDEAAVRQNAALAQEIVTSWAPPSTLPLRIVVDDGWQRGWGDWRPNAKFPSGLDGLAKDLKAQGFRMGVWLAPLLVAENDPLVTAHPDWFVGNASYLHLKNGKMRILDVTHPGAAAHLQGVIAQIVGWGYDLLKIDFLFAGTYEGPRHEPVTGMQAYDRALALIREAAGYDTVLLAVGAPALPTLRYVDVWRVGGDIAVENFGAVWAFLPNQLRSLAARSPFCVATVCDADPAILRDLSKDEVGFGSWVVATAGGAGFLSDDLRKLPVERRAWANADGQVPIWVSGRTGQPEVPFPQDPPDTLVSALADHLAGTSTHVVPRVWVLRDYWATQYRVAFNPTGAAVTVDGVAVPPHAARRID